MNARDEKNTFNDLPQSAQEFIKLVIKKMGYRRKVRLEVRQELAAHFEDELRNCTDEQQRLQKSQQIIEQFGDVKLLGVLLRRAKKRCRPLWRTVVVRSFQAVLLLFGLLVIYCVYLSLGLPTIKIDYVKKLTEIAHPKADESQNAAILYEQATASYKEPPVIQVDNQAGPNDLESMTKNLLEIIKEKSVHELTQAELAGLNEWVENNSQSVVFYIQGSKKPYYWRHRESTASNLLEMEMPELGQMRRLSILVSWRAKLKAERGDIDGAFEDLFAIYRAGMHFEGPRTIIEQLVGIAIRAVAVSNAIQIVHSTQLDEQTLRHVQNEFQLLADKDDFRISYKAERFYLMDFIQRSYTDDGKGSGRMSPAGVMPFVNNDEYVDSFAACIPALGASLISPNRKNMEELTRDFYDFFDGQAELTPWQSRNTPINEKYQIENWSKIKKFRYWPISYLMPALAKVNQLSYRIRTDSEALITITALQRYERQYGFYPENLDELVKAKLLKAVPIDPFSNKPLRYKKTDDSFILYSVGLDFKDNGGVLGTYTNGKKWMWADEGDAVFWPVQK